MDSNDRDRRNPTPQFFTFQEMILFLIFLSLFVTNDTGILLAQTPKLTSWSVKFKGIGLFSSPRVTDLNGDGVGDIVFGAGREEFKACDSAIIALNGLNGEVLWKVPSVDHIFGSAILKDLDRDAIDEVFIGGRSAEFMAINGRTGKIIWKFDKKKAGLNGFGIIIQAATSLLHPG